MSRAARLAWLAALPLAACTYYTPPPPTVTTVPVTQTVTTPANYDRSFNAAAGAMRDQGVSVTREDAAAGAIVGSLDSAVVTASLVRQADGSVRVEFHASAARDATLVDRITRSYQARMGR
jgi:hypothetical protein